MALSGSNNKGKKKMTSSVDGFFKQIAIALIIAAILGTWAFAATRASSVELNLLERESKAGDAAIISKLDDHLKEAQIDAIAQAEFRAEVRQALNIQKR